MDWLSMTYGEARRSIEDRYGKGRWRLGVALWYGHGRSGTSRPADDSETVQDVIDWLTAEAKVINARIGGADCVIVGWLRESDPLLVYEQTDVSNLVGVRK